MSQNGSCPCIETEQIYRVRMALSKEQPRYHNRRDTFQAVPGQYNQPGFRPQYPQGVGGAGISASMLPDAANFIYDQMRRMVATFVETMM